MELVVAGIRRTQERHGPDAVGCFGGGGLTNEQAYQFGKFARVALRTSQIDYNGRFCMSSAAGAATVRSAWTAACRSRWPTSARPTSWCWWAATRRHHAPGHAVPRRLPGEGRPPVRRRPPPDGDRPRRRAAPAGPAGTDLALANGLLHIAVAEGLVDEQYVAARTTGWDAVRESVQAYWPDRVERLTGVPVAAMRRVVLALAGAENAIVLTARGAEQHRNGTDTAQAWVNLSLALGLVGRPGSGWGTVTGQGNGQGGREHGQKADQLPGYRMLADPAARAHVAAVWASTPTRCPSPVAARSSCSTPSAATCTPCSCWPPTSRCRPPDARRVMSRLRDLDLLVVSDFFLSETAELADVVLPSAMWAEEDGTMTNLEGRVIRRRRTLDPPGEARDDLALLADLADRLGAGAHFSADPETVFAELGRASAGGKADYAGITWARVDDEQGVFWPCPTPDHPGTPRLFLDRFPTPDGRPGSSPSSTSARTSPRTPSTPTCSPPAA